VLPTSIASSIGRDYRRVHRAGSGERSQVLPAVST
jgi:hypothetical protein